MTNHRNVAYAKAIDCGDGVPVLSLLDHAESDLDLELEEMLEKTELAGTANAEGNVADADETDANKPDTIGVDPATTVEADKAAVELAGLIVTARTTAVAATVIVQLVIALAVILGANPVVGGLAAFAMMTTGVGLALVGAISTD